ncbi:uncharacterized protein MYCGRDRAFT_97543 [Zymoseptoria tritici IPO323]|uniref:Kinesin motor domain-containing protein n=1 Tax=Zymoseptoria tritici (strain CBS 115943 / IPO323) TaxID=336722 RepID=F9XQJ8_ZYMTI|nr:uncharacterized protein MYCGRDRAFT_97543 [Zymoseptoria tritici IPO323]EGP82479.1 hypothetical protein MYCGRDRAFT_97543 [Zymoseptoria tritici IPO323]
MEQPKPSTALFDVFLRLRPSAAIDKERFLDVEPGGLSAPTHITIKSPTGDTRKRAVERFAFTRVFEENAGQRSVRGECWTARTIREHGSRGSHSRRVGSTWQRRS